jgi:hypothetical protein
VLVLVNSASHNCPIPHPHDEVWNDPKIHGSSPHGGSQYCSGSSWHPSPCLRTSHGSNVPDHLHRLELLRRRQQQPQFNGFCKTDNASLTVYREGRLSGAGQSQVSSVLAAEYGNPTILSVTVETTPSYSGSSETDIIYQYYSVFPPGSSGIAWCDDAL